MHRAFTRGLDLSVLPPFIGTQPEIEIFTPTPPSGVSPPHAREEDIGPQSALVSSTGRQRKEGSLGDLGVPSEPGIASLPTGGREPPLPAGP